LAAWCFFISHIIRYFLDRTLGTTELPRISSRHPGFQGAFIDFSSRMPDQSCRCRIMCWHRSFKGYMGQGICWPHHQPPRLLLGGVSLNDKYESANIVFLRGARLPPSFCSYRFLVSWYFSATLHEAGLVPVREYRTDNELTTPLALKRLEEASLS